ncbi:hypothetical protein GOP47_0017009 [Adiantum capillus-veneris]|uniref:Uncharacterized protein n=1 Tax=Adiantum capillus-veneris TaxID=13818 RepID=A0A9D4ZB79_ADICA|nr:hypothetical protein GOP47_0017009 [Adiantum capillus-veneris]
MGTNGKDSKRALSQPLIGTRHPFCSRICRFHRNLKLKITGFYEMRNALCRPADDGNRYSLSPLDRESLSLSLSLSLSTLLVVALHTAHLPPPCIFARSIGLNPAPASSLAFRSTRNGERDRDVLWITSNEEGQATIFSICLCICGVDICAMWQLHWSGFQRERAHPVPTPTCLLSPLSFAPFLPPPTSPCLHASSLPHQRERERERERERRLPPCAQLRERKRVQAIYRRCSLQKLAGPPFPRPVRHSLLLRLLLPLLQCTA